MRLSILHQTEAVEQPDNVSSHKILQKPIRRSHEAHSFSIFADVGTSCHGAIFALFQSSPQITAGELQKHVKYLASDELEGRRVGSKGANAAADYIANELKTYGLKPLGDKGTYFQNFDFVSGIKLDKINTLAVTISGKSEGLTPEKDYRPLGFSSSESYSGGVVFVGYGISDTSKKYNDYAGIDVKARL